MIKAFFEDVTGFKRKIFLIIGFSLVMFFISSFLTNEFVKVNSNNQKLTATYVEEGKWLNNFNYKNAEKLNEKFLKPVDESQIDRVQMEQLSIIKNHGIIVDSVRQDKNTKLNNLNLVRYEVTLVSNWEAIMAALNEFETVNLVVITDLEMTPTKDGTIITKLVYNIYYKN